MSVAEPREPDSVLWGDAVVIGVVVMTRNTYFRVGNAATLENKKLITNFLISNFQIASIKITKILKYYKTSKF